MYKISNALLWEYFARNRWTLILCALCANLPMVVLFAVLGDVGSGMDGPATIMLKAILTLALVFGVCLGVVQTQANVTQLYLMPVSTRDIVRFIWGLGALLVGLQVALYLAFWNWLIGSEIAIAGPVLFSIVSWSVSLPIFLVSCRSLRWIASFFAALAVMLVWFLYGFGVLLGSGNALSPNVHPWSTLSILDIAVATVITSIADSLTLKRIANHRSGRQHDSFSERIADYFTNRFQSKPHTAEFGSPDKALEWFDKKTRTSGFVRLFLCSVAFVWLIALFIAGVSKSQDGLVFAFVVKTILAIELLIVSLVALPLTVYKRIGVIQNRFGKKFSDSKNKGSVEVSVFQTAFLGTLPLSASQKSQILLRSSAKSGIQVGAIFLCSFVAMYIWAWTVGVDTNQFMSSVKLGQFRFERFAAVLTVCSMLLTFIVFSFSLLKISSLIKYQVLIPTSMLGLVLWAANTPIEVTLLSMFAALAICIVTNSTIQSLLNRDISLASTAVIWLDGALSVPILAVLFSGELGTIAITGSILLIATAMIPFFSLPSALRELRTS